MNAIQRARLRHLASTAMLIGLALWFVVFVGPQWGLLGQGHRPNGIVGGAAFLLAGLTALAVPDGRPPWGLMRFGAWFPAAAIAILVGGNAALPYFGLPSFLRPHELNGAWYVIVAAALVVALHSDYRLQIRIVRRSGPQGRLG